MVLVLFVVLWRILSVTPQGNDGAVFAGAPTAVQGGEHSADIPGPDGETVSPTFSFLTTEQDASMRWFGCRRISHVVRLMPDGTPSIALETVEHALAAAESSSWFGFERVGTAHWVPVRGTRSFGHDNIEFWIGGNAPDEYEGLTERVAGLGGPRQIARPVDSPRPAASSPSATMPSGTLAGATGSSRSPDLTFRIVEAFAMVKIDGDHPYHDLVQVHVLLHELGHAMGLDHVQNNAEMMAPRGSVERVTYGPGDREWLRQASEGMRCG